MVSLTSPVCNFGWKAKPFSLLSTSNSMISLNNSMGENGLLIMFICNHCPYVKAILPRLIHDTRELKDYGVNTVAISANDQLNYPEDSFENMRILANKEKFPFEYCFDETQEVAKAYEAICTPDFFGFNRSFEIQYRGRFDSTGRNEPSENNERDLFNAMKYIAQTQSGPKEQISSIGCSIKWKEN
ncbi:MAG: thioredoxin family protein [Methylophilaceae bacterium]